MLLEQHENFQKQSYRNRCCIYGANGKQSLVIPVRHRHHEKIPIARVTIDHSEPWQKNHLKAIESAYRLSPFFEYYADELCAPYQQKEPSLLLWNHNFLTLVLKILGIPQDLYYTSSWQSEHANCSDFRNSIHPKTRLQEPDSSFRSVVYPQVFQEKYGFLSNLSIIDLILNEGPHALRILKESVVIGPNHSLFAPAKE